MNNQLLNKKTISEITSKKYENKTFELQGFNIPENKKRYKNKSEEKRLQWLVNLQLEQLLNEPIIEEKYDFDYEGQVDGYILLNELKYAIKHINKTKIQTIQKDFPHLSEKEIINKIKDDFVSRYLETINIDYKKQMNLFDLFLNFKQELNITIKNKKYTYSVIDFENKNINKIKIIKEKKLKIDNSYHQADFAIYFNGLPFFAVEMKKTENDGRSGTKAALEDYKRKKSYHNFLSFIGTNGSEVFISSNPKFNDFFIWEEYENYDEDSIYNNGLYDLSKEILTSPKNMLFYFSKTTMRSENDDYLKVARIQQYMTVKKFNTLFNTENLPFSRYFQHHTRTGKSYTFKLISNLIYHSHRNKFKKIIFFTHDVSSVLASVQKEFQNIEYIENKKIKVINSKKEYENILKGNTSFDIFIVNMQKISKEEKTLDPSKNILILIDEVHTHQKLNKDDISEIKSMADKRKKHFPNASIIAATASPIIQEKKDHNGKMVQINITEQFYGECIDKLTPDDALRLKLVTQLQYLKSKYKSDTKRSIQLKTQEIEKLLEKEIRDRVLSSIDQLKEKTLTTIEDIDNKTIEEFKDFDVNKQNYKNITYSLRQTNNQKLLKLLNNLQININSSIQKNKRNLKEIFENKIWEIQLPFKIKEQVIQKVKEQKKQVKQFYDLKAFYVVPRYIKNGRKFLEVLKELIQEEIDKNPNYDKNEFDVDNNIYFGIRFGFDNDGDDTFELNGDLGGKADITSLFEVDETKEKAKTKAVDVLVLVKKKLMGYDNKNLTIVFLDKEIRITNIKEMLQFSTRGTTKREGKEMGIIIDLTFSNQNIETFQKAFNVYNDKETKSFLVDDDIIKQSVNVLKETIEDFKALFLKEKEFYTYSMQNILNEENKTDLFIKLQKEYWSQNKNKNFLKKYIDLVSKIDKEYKKLISPTYILNLIEEYQLLSQTTLIYKLNYMLLEDIKNKQSEIYQTIITDKEILDILEKSFSVFGGVKEFIVNMGISLKELEEIKITKDKDIDIKRKMTTNISNLLKEINKYSNIGNAHILLELEKIQLYVDTDQKPLEPKEKQLKEIELLIKKQKEKRKEEIKNEFNNDELAYEIYSKLENTFKNITEDYQGILKIQALNLSKEISDNLKVCAVNIPIEEKIIRLLNESNCSINFSNSNFINELKSNDLFDIYKKIHQDLNNSKTGFYTIEKKEITRKLEDGYQVSEIKDHPVLDILLFKLKGEGSE